MRNLLVTCGLLLLTASSLAQGKRLWVLRSPGEMVEYDPATFAAKQTVKVPAEAMKSPESVRVNRAGTNFICDTGTAAAGGRRCCVGAQSLALEWAQRDHDRSRGDARGKCYGIESGDHGDRRRCHFFRRTADIYFGLRTRRGGCSARAWIFRRSRPGRRGGLI